MGSGLFHLTLAMLRLHGDEGIDEATKLVEGLQDELQELLSKRGDKKAGIECFESISSFSFLCFIQSTQCKVPFYNILMLIFDATLEARQNLNLIPLAGESVKRVSNQFSAHRITFRFGKEALVHD